MHHSEAVKVGRGRGVVKFRALGDKLGPDAHVTKISPSGKLRLDQNQLTADLSAKNFSGPPKAAPMNWAPSPTLQPTRLTGP